MKPKRRKSTRRAIRRAVYGGLSRLRKSIGDDDGPTLTTNGSGPLVNGAGRSPGILRPSTGALRLPDGLAEAGDAEPDSPQSWIPGPIVLFIIVAALIFISVIAWFVSQMPDK
jgi:hypothetical protein